MEVLIRNKCKECDGSGVVANSLWIEFYRIENRYVSMFKIYPEMGRVEKWFQKRGFSKMPQEESTCCECEGIGKIQSWTPLIKTLSGYAIT